MASFYSPAHRAALEDMRIAEVDTSVFTKEELICIYSGVYKKPRFDFLKGQHQGAAFEKAYKQNTNK